MRNDRSEQTIKREVMTKSAGECQDSVAKPAAEAVASHTNGQTLPYSTTRRAANIASFSAPRNTPRRTLVASSSRSGHDTQSPSCGVRKVSCAEQTFTADGVTNAATPHPHTVSPQNPLGVNNHAAPLMATVRTPRSTAVAVATVDKIAESVETPKGPRKASSRTPSKAEPIAAFGRKVYREPADVDVLFGRGRAYRAHPGNRRMKELVGLHQKEYDEASRDDKTDLAWNIVSIIHSEQGRFLKSDKNNNNRWYEVPDESAREKVSHAFRDGRPRMRAETRAETIDAHLAIDVGSNSLLAPSLSLSASNLITTRNLPVASSRREGLHFLNTNVATTASHALFASPHLPSNLLPLPSVYPSLLLSFQLEQALAAATRPSLPSNPPGEGNRGSRVGFYDFS